MESLIRDIRWLALPGFVAATWAAFALATLVRLAAMGGALTELDGRETEAPKGAVATEYADQ